MKKVKRVFVFINMILIFILTTSCHTHHWLSATCTEAEICEGCGEVRGEPKGHHYVTLNGKNICVDCLDILKPDPTPEPIPEELKGYYKEMNGHLDESFKSSLHLLLKNTHTTVLSYTPGVWDALKIVDKGEGDTVKCLYTGQLIPADKKDDGQSHSYSVWNREHSWPNSHGFSSKDYAAYTDLHHLFASEKNINATRGNKDWGYVTNGSSDAYGNRWNSTTFEIRDEMKGDIARAMFYLVVRYDDTQELDLELVEGATESSSNKTGQLGSLSILLEWNSLDSVSEEELARNEAIYQIQGNRNPFVDYPEWVSLLYPSD